MEEEQGSGAEWYDEWNQWSPDDWLNDDWSLEERDWNGEWIGSVDDWSGDWSWFEDDWSSWPEDWSWNTQEWWNPTEAQLQSSNGAASSGSNIPQDTAKNEPPQNVSAVTVDSSDQSAPRVAKTIRGNKTWTDDEFVRWSVLVDWCIEFRSTTNAEPESTKSEGIA